MNYIYKIFVGKILLYVSRSKRPRSRLLALRRRLGDPTLRQVVVKSFSSFAKAQQCELELIKRLKPPLNKRVVSSPGHLGKRHSKAAREGTRRGLLGRRLSKEHRDKIRDSINAALLDPVLRTKRLAKWRQANA